MDETFVVGASASLNKTISALLDSVENPGSRVRGNLRESMEEALADLALEWTQWGFERGHRVAYEQFRNDGKFPPMIESDEGVWNVMPGCSRHVVLESRTRRN